MSEPVILKELDKIFEQSNQTWPFLFKRLQHGDWLRRLGMFETADIITNVRSMKRDHNIVIITSYRV